MFELAEEALDEIALAVELVIDRALHLAFAAGRDVVLAATLADEFDDGSGVVAAIGGVRQAGSRTESASSRLQASSGDLTRQAELLRSQVDRFLATVRGQAAA